LSTIPNILVYGYGNPGRQDDGLGIAIIEKLEAWAQQEGINNVKFDSNYQLNIEDAYNIAEYDIVLFVDASIESLESYAISEVIASEKVNFTMHASSPSFVLDLCQKIYSRYPETYLFHIKGYEWELKEGLTEKAKRNLEEVFTILISCLKEPSLLKENIVVN
jgi:hydrogenase maturation protease